MALSVYYKIDFEEKFLKQKEFIACVEFVINYYKVVVDALFSKYLR